MASGTYVNAGETSFTAQGGTYTIKAYGAQGGGNSTGTGGLGAEVVGTFTTTAGETIEIVVGGVGGSGGGSGGGGGGGGTFVLGVVGGVTTKLLVAGGGGGAGYAPVSTNNGLSGYISPAGSGVAGSGGAGYTGFGFGGGGGGGSKGGAGGGAGYSNTLQAEYGKSGGAGSNLTSNPSSAGSYAGGAAYTSPFATTGAGGFGGGGGGGYFGGGGGGGGFGGGSGGAGYYNSSSFTGGGLGGQGGGSYDGGSNRMEQAAVSPNNAGNGEVVVTQAPLCFLRGTRILTPTGEVRVEDLQVGDMVVTRFGGMQPCEMGRPPQPGARERRQHPRLHPRRRAGRAAAGAGTYMSRRATRCWWTAPC